jgi:pyrophosphatase PpaX
LPDIYDPTFAKIIVMKQYDYILLDWDGNIAHTLNLWPKALDEVLQKRGFLLTRQQLIESTWGFVAYVTKNTNITPKKATKAMEEANEIVVSRSPSVELFPDAPEVLAELKESGKHLALITTSERRMIMPVLERYKIADLFETIITDNDIHKEHRKPHPKPLLMALEQMGGTPDKAIMVGDRDKDIVGGHNAGMDSVLFCSVEHQRHYNLEKLMEHKPTYVISEFCDLLKVANGVQAPVVRS